MDKLTYNAPELALLLGISRSAAYNLMHRADFPSFRISKRLLVKQAERMAGRAGQNHPRLSAAVPVPRQRLLSHHADKQWHTSRRGCPAMGSPIFIPQ